MNAKEISDATLESVTPADNDFMLIYDTSERTTGKATIAGIAPKVAENINISTLPEVTPAADDVLMIRDTSERTTGKATIADIAPKVKGGIATENEPTDEFYIFDVLIKNWTGKNVSELSNSENLLVTIFGQVTANAVVISSVLIGKTAKGAYTTTVICPQQSYTVTVDFYQNEFRGISIIHTATSPNQQYIITAEIINK